jgi:hypothetical protein
VTAEVAEKTIKCTQAKSNQQQSSKILKRHDTASSLPEAYIFIDEFEDTIHRAALLLEDPSISLLPNPPVY